MSERTEPRPQVVGDGRTGEGQKLMRKAGTV